MPTVKFVREKKEIEVPAGTDIRAAAKMAGVNVYQGINGFGAALNKFFNCHGLGLCGTCSVNVVKGMENTSKPGLMERLKYKGIPIPDLACMQCIGNEKTIRLACKARVLGDV